MVRRWLRCHGDGSVVIEMAPLWSCDLSVKIWSGSCYHVITTADFHSEITCFKEGLSRWIHQTVRDFNKWEKSVSLSLPATTWRITLNPAAAQPSTGHRDYWCEVWLRSSSSSFLSARVSRWSALLSDSKVPSSLSLNSWTNRVFWLPGLLHMLRSVSPAGPQTLRQDVLKTVLQTWNLYGLISHQH